MSITVIITTWQVPFDQQVREIKTFSGEKANSEALEFINQQAAQWWDDNEGDRWEAEARAEGEKPESSDWAYQPIKELGYDTAHYEIWGGENGFHAMLDETSYAKLHEAHYKREYDDKGLTRPGYLINAYVSGAKPGGTTEAEAEQYEREQAAGMDELQSFVKPN